MKRSRRSQNHLLLGILILLGILYCSLLYFHVRLTPVHQWDGILGVLLGLFTSAQPAANALDQILFGRDRPELNLSWQSAPWWTFNLVVLLVGWVDIVMALLRYTAAQ